MEALWCEVLLQALTDGLSSLPVIDAFIEAGTEIPARDNILVPNPDFETVCVIAITDSEALPRASPTRLAARKPKGVHETWDMRKAERRAPKPVPTFTSQGRSLTLGEWAEVSGLFNVLLTARVNRPGRSIERVLTEPVGRHTPKRSRADLARIASRLPGL